MAKGDWKMVYSDYKENDKMRVKYLRKSNRKPYACFVYLDGEFGWSMCDKEDQFDKKFGRNLARQRAFPIEDINLLSVPPSIRDEFVEFMKRTFAFEALKNIKNIVKVGDPLVSLEEALRLETDYTREFKIVLDMKIECSQYDPF